MNKLKISIFTLSLSLIVFSCEESAENTIENGKTEIENVNQIEEVNTIAENVNADEFKLLLQKGGVLIDVRTPGEVSNGSIDGHTNIDFNGSDFKSELEKLDKNTTVLVYCASGGRSGKTMAIMNDMGFKEVYNLNGGYNGWPNK